MLVIPRGNLIQNPGFELALEFWIRPLNTPYTLRQNVVALGQFPHSGLSAAAFGHFNTQYVSVIYQDVPISPGNTYELDFHVAGLSRCPVQFNAEARWLDDGNTDLGVGLAIPVAAVASASDGQWTLHTGITEGAPLGARKARISFTSSTAIVLLDDVLFFRTE